MATYKTAAIILGRHNFGEADRIIVLLTPERGVIRGVARGVRRIKSRLAGHLELFSRSDLMLAEGRNLDVITSARLVRHLPVGDDYDRMRLAYLFAEMINRLSGDAEPHPGLFELADETYAALTAGPPGATLELWFKLRLLDRLGYRPELGHCTVCHTPASAERQYAFRVELGGLVDAGCRAAGDQPITHGQIKLWRLVLDHPLATVCKVGEADALAAASLPLCNAFYDYTFGKRFRSAETLA